MKISSNRKIGDVSLLNNLDEETWEKAYKEIVNPKYQKGKRNFSRKFVSNVVIEQPPIYMVARERGGASYKDIEVKECRVEDIYFAPISKGYSMGDVSSFTLGPVVGKGFCIVNCAFSKVICLHHLQGGSFDSSRKDFWKTLRKPVRNISMDETSEYLIIDGEKIEKHNWLHFNKHLWYPEWKKWSDAIALCSDGDFHWTDKSETVAFFDTIRNEKQERFLTFVEWKKECYIKPAYELIPKTSVYHYLTELRKKGCPIALVHPKAKEYGYIDPITKEELEMLFDSDIMCCMPYVVAALLLGVKIDSC